MPGEHVVPDVDLTRLEPRPVHVVVNPADDIPVDDDAGRRRGIGITFAEKPVEDLVASGDQSSGVAWVWRTDRDDTVGRGPESRHARSLTRPIRAQARFRA